MLAAKSLLVFHHFSPRYFKCTLSARRFFVSQHTNHPIRLASLSLDSQRFLDRLGFFGWQFGLERIEKLCNFFGQPQLKYPTVHIAGTNGKGSTAAIDTITQVDAKSKQRDF